MAYQFATCFICKQTGHLAKACPGSSPKFSFFCATFHSFWPFRQSERAVPERRGLPILRKRRTPQERVSPQDREGLQERGARRPPRRRRGGRRRGRARETSPSQEKEAGGQAPGKSGQLLSRGAVPTRQLFSYKIKSMIILRKQVLNDGGPSQG
jgi:hypothetical protein